MLEPWLEHHKRSEMEAFSQEQKAEEAANVKFVQDKINKLRQELQFVERLTKEAYDEEDWDAGAEMSAEAHRLDAELGKLAP